MKKIPFSQQRKISKDTKTAQNFARVNIKMKGHS